MKFYIQIFATKFLNVIHDLLGELNAGIEKRNLIIKNKTQPKNNYSSNM